MKQFLLFLSIIVFALSGVAQTQYTTAAINLRDAPNGNVLSVVPKGQSLDIGPCENGWCETTYSGHEGYVNKAYLSDRHDQTIKTNGNQALSPVHYYTNSSGNSVQSPTQYASPPSGASAKCADGTYSFSQHRRGTCSHHGGVIKWL
jgi:uncharacterized protein YgiM (DUF1202 family)